MLNRLAAEGGAFNFGDDIRGVHYLSAFGLEIAAQVATQPVQVMDRRGHALSPPLSNRKLWAKLLAVLTAMRLVERTSDRFVASSTEIEVATQKLMATANDAPGGATCFLFRDLVFNPCGSK